MLNIVIPMAGLGSRFKSAGYEEPKPLIPIHGIPMIAHVLRNLTPIIAHRFIFICQQQHVEIYELEKLFKKWAPGYELILLDEITEGAACSVLKAKHFINNNSPLMIANSDQYIDIDINDYLNFMDAKKLDCLIMTMTADDPKWSFVGFDSNGFVTRVVEKEVISNEATVGVYNFKSGEDFVMAAEKMIEENLRVNNEFYVAPAYNNLITAGKNVGIYNIGTEANGMYGLGTPNDLNLFLSLEVSQISKRNVLCK